jgi:hypothetical protein
MPRFPGPYREPGRKTDYYMPPYAQGLDDYSFLEHVCTEKREERHRPLGKDAFRESLEHALRGDRHPTQVSCLRGRLRKAVIELATDIHAASAERDEASRLQMRVAAIERILGVLHGYNVIPESQDGQIVWRLRLPR